MRFNYLKLPELPKDERKLVGFVLNDVCYGLPIMSVREVINPRRVTKIPSLPPFVLGMAEHRNDVIPIVDLRARFHMERLEQTRRTKWIIAVIENKEIGIEVDRATEVTTVDPTMKKDKPLWTLKSEPWIAEIFQTKTALIFELNLPALVDFDVFAFEDKVERK
jgi:purine-binding chemotaxis protein CheW